MVGNSKHNDRTFDPAHYEEFYEDHHFQPLTEEDAFNCHEVIPRFGWAFDIIEELQASRETPLRVLDLGCLDGSFCLTIARHLPIHQAVGVDLTKDGIDIAKSRSDGKSTYFYQGTVEWWLREFVERGVRFDVITWFEIIEHVEDPAAVQALIDKVLAPGGTVLVSTPAFESPTFGKDDEQNKCHIRLYTLKDDDYEEANKFGNVRKATSLPKFLGKDRIVSAAIHSELINCRYQ